MRKFIEQMTKEAGDAILKIFRKTSLKYRTKENEADFVTEADELSNKILLAAIRKQFPDHGIISEETGEERDTAEYLWILDPLDGTRNFLTHTPMWGVMVGLARRSKMVAAAIYDPNAQEFIYSERGKGVFLNHKRVHCSRSRYLKFSHGSIKSTIGKEHPPLFRNALKTLGERGLSVNAFGAMASSTLYAACGRRDWLVASEGPVWDRAIPALILSESGCRVTDYRGKSWKFGDKDMVAANPVLHPQLLKLLR